MATIGRFIGRGVGAATRYGKMSQGKNRLIADFEDDVIQETAKDIAQIKKGLRARIAEAEDPEPRGAALRRQSVQEAAGRAMTRTGSRALAIGTAGAVGAGIGEAIEEEANKTRRRLMEEKKKEEEKKDTAPKRVNVAPRSMDDDEKPVEKKEDKKMSFGEAFAAARREDKKTFTWQGKLYGTELAKPAPKASVRESENKNIDEDTRRRAMQSVDKEEMARGGMVKKKKPALKYAEGGSIPTIYPGVKAGAKAPKKPSTLSRKMSTKIKKPSMSTARSAAMKVKTPTAMAHGGMPMRGKPGPAIAIMIALPKGKPKGKMKMAVGGNVNPARQTQLANNAAYRNVAQKKGSFAIGSAESQNYRAYLKGEKEKARGNAAYTPTAFSATTPYAKNLKAQRDAADVAKKAAQAARKMARGGIVKKKKK